MLRLRSFFIYMIAMSAIVIVLKIMSEIPPLIQERGVHHFSSIEEVKRALKIQKIYLPSYFPQYFQWPPFEIYGQSDPQEMIVMHIKERYTDDIVLAIIQTDLALSKPLYSRIEPQKIEKQETIQIKGNPVVLLHAFCSDGRMCNKLIWEEHGYRLSVVAKESLIEVVKIAESMMSE